MQKRACKAASASSEFQLRHLCHLSQLLPLVTSKGIAIVMLRTLLMETGCLCSQATPFFMASSSKVPPSFLPAHSYGYRAGGWQTELGDVLHHFPSHGCQHGSQDQSLISSPCSPPGDCSWRGKRRVPQRSTGRGCSPLQADGSCSIPAFSCFAVLWGHDGILPA